MTSGSKTAALEGCALRLPRRRGLLVLAAAGWATALPRRAGAQTRPFDLPALMALLAQRKAGQARFSEERHVSGIEGPLRASGTLSFVAPDRFTRRTLEPRAESMEVAGNTVLLVRSGRTRQMALDAVPELAALVEAVRGTLGGNGAALSRHFKAEVQGNAERWQLGLKPLAAGLAQWVSGIEIGGLGSEVRSVEVLMRNGDRSLMLVEPVANRP